MKSTSRGLISCLILFVVIAAGCSSKRQATLSEYPLNKGTTWVYSYEAYEPSDSDPSQIINATYQLTETVIETETVPPYFVAHLKKEHQLVNADVGWKGWTVSDDSSETWYVVNGRQVFESYQPIDAAIEVDDLSLAYDFPLSADKTWCLIDDCQQGGVGWRIAISQGPYETPAGKFGDCYEMVDRFNPGAVYQQFCTGVGVVYKKFDHSGTRYGYEQTLIRFSTGSEK